MREIEILPKARLDILEIWHYIARDSVDAANRVNEKIQAEIENLRDFPGKGHTRTEVQDSSLSFWKVYSYLIAYRYDERRITIVRVVHGARNLRSVFRGKKS